MLCYDVPPAYYEQMVAPYRDSYGLIVQSDKDGGDAAHRIGVYYYGLSLIYQKDAVNYLIVKKQFDTDLSKIRKSPGQFVRHPDSSKWYSNPKNFTRDQTTPLIIALGAFNEKDEVKANLLNLIKNFGFYPNDLKNWTNHRKSLPYDFNDIASMSDYATYIRSLKTYFLYPYLLFSDVILFGNSLTRTYFSYFDKSDTSDDLTFTLSLLQADNVMPTPFSKLAKLVYSSMKAKVEPPDASGYKSTLPIQTSWDYYFRTSSTAPPLGDVYKCVIGKYFYDKDELNRSNSIVQK